VGLAARNSLDEPTERGTKFAPMLRACRHLARVTLGLCAIGLLGCENYDPKRNPFDPPPNAPKPAPAVTEVPKPQGPPAISIDNMGPKIGFTQLILQRPSDYEKLQKEIETLREHYQGKDVHVSASRDTNTQWIAAVLGGLEDIGASPLFVRTPTRAEFSGELQWATPRKFANAPSCSVVAMVRADRGTAVWRLSGGTAGKRSKGFAGPDLSMTGDTLERYYKGCKQSDILFISGAEGIEWGLVYDLAASAKKLEKANFQRLSLLFEPPTAGRPIRLIK
jgi:biopolymer transport protein ExbD